MKRIINFLFSFICVCIFCVPAYVFTVDLGVESYVTDAGKAAGYDVANTDEFSLSKYIGQVVNIVLSIIGVLFTVLMVYAGYLWMTARGADEQIEKAKSMITAAIIGIIITLGAYSISAFVVPRILASTTV